MFSTFNSLSSNISKNNIIEKVGGVVTGYTFKVKGSTSTVPTTDICGTTLTNFSSVIMYLDATRGYVFSFSGSNYLSINIATPTICTRTFWLSTNNTSFPGVDANVFTSSNFPIYFPANKMALNFAVNSQNIDCTIQQGASWIFYAVTVTATNAYVYVNGSSVANVSSSYASWSGDSTASRFGSYNGTGNNYTGYIDDMRMYPFVLSAKQIASIYTGG
jgi:hypothetical protein